MKFGLIPQAFHMVPCAYMSKLLQMYMTKDLVKYLFWGKQYLKCLFKLGLWQVFRELSRWYSQPWQYMSYLSIRARKMLRVSTEYCSQYCNSNFKNISAQHQLYTHNAIESPRLVKITEVSENWWNIVYIPIIE